MKHSKKNKITLTLDDYIIEDFKKVAISKNWSLSFLVNMALTSVYNEVIVDYLKDLGGAKADDIKSFFGITSK